MTGPLKEIKPPEINNMPSGNDVAAIRSYLYRLCEVLSYNFAQIDRELEKIEKERTEK